MVNIASRRSSTCTIWQGDKSHIIHSGGCWRWTILEGKDERNKTNCDWVASGNFISLEILFNHAWWADKQGADDVVFVPFKVLQILRQCCISSWMVSWESAWDGLPIKTHFEYWTCEFILPPPFQRHLHGKIVRSLRVSLSSLSRSFKIN